MESEIILLTRIVFSLLFLTFLSRFSKAWLYTSIAVNLILIANLGAKTVSFFGFLTNAGNLFYVCIVFAIYLLIEHHGSASARLAIWMGIVFSIFSLIMAELIVNTPGTVESRQLDEALRQFIGVIPRVSFASLVAFLVSQNINISLYTAMLRKSGGEYLWLRNMVGVVVVQMIDSLIFFPIAFYAVLGTDVFIEAMIVGFVMKVGIGFLSTPFLYLSYRLKKE